VKRTAVAIACIACIAGIVYAAGKQNADFGHVKMNTLEVKTLKIGGDPINGTDSTEVTATAAELNAVADGDITGTGGVTATLNINYPAAQGTNTVTEKFSGVMGDGNNRVWQITGANDSNETVVLYKEVVTLDDNTTNTEDTAYEIWIEKAGVLTKVVDVDALGAAIVGNVAGTTIGGITQANLVDKSATESVTGAWSYTLDVSVDAKYAVVGPDATTGLMIVTGTFTNLQPTITFGTVFASAPKVCANWTSDISAATGTNYAIGVTSVTASNWVPKTVATASLNGNYIAIGARP